MPTRSRADSIPLIAGHPVLDLVNTVSWRGDVDRSVDHLHHPEHCLTWGQRCGVLSVAESDQLRLWLTHRDAGEAMTSGLRHLRSVVADAVITPNPTTLAAAQDVILDAIRASHLSPSEAAERSDGGRTYRWQVSSLDEHTAARRLALDFEALLRAPSGRIGVCADVACQWIFLDTSRAQNRRWCSSTDCGNRHRVQRHQRRTHPRTRPILNVDTSVLRSS